MKTEILVILEYGGLEQCHYGEWDWIQYSKGYVFDDYEKARLWVLAWVRDYNKDWKKTEADESGKIVELDEPVMKETAKDTWESFSAEIVIYRIGEIDMDGFEATEKVCLS